MRLSIRTCPWLAQFDHRIGAYIVAGFAAFITVRSFKLAGYAKTSGKAVGIITAIQIFLGIATLMMQAPQGLAALHQVTAALLLCAAVWHAYELRISAPDRAGLVPLWRGAQALGLLENGGQCVVAVHLVSLEFDLVLARTARRRRADSIVHRSTFCGRGKIRSGPRPT